MGEAAVHRGLAQPGSYPTCTQQGGLGCLSPLGADSPTGKAMISLESVPPPSSGISQAGAMSSSKSHGLCLTQGVEGGGAT